MITRRVVAVGAFSVFFEGAASAQVMLLSAATRQSILEVRALAENDAARYRAYAPLFASAARNVASADRVLSDALGRIGRLFPRAANALTDGANAIPQPLPAAAPDLRQQIGPSQLPLGAGLQQGSPTPPPAPTVRVTPTRRAPTLEPGVALISPENRPLTEGVIFEETGAGALAWRRIADGFRSIEQRTRVAVGVSAAHFETAARLLGDAQVQLVRARFSSAGSEDADRLGNFEIQDIVRRANQSGTLASSVRRKLEETSTTIAQNVG